ncbi:MAG: HNH endonuclease [Candidatus Bathyarchaeia archaeon]
MSNDDELHFLSAGISSDIAKKVIAKGYTLQKLVNLPPKKSSQIFPNISDGSIEGTSISETVNRKPIPIQTVKKLLLESDSKCCICWTFSETPIIIHHIEEYEKTWDNSYPNLVVLCPNHHALAHSEWHISRHPLSPEILQKRKKEWKKAITDFKRGLRLAPGRENDKFVVFNQNDKDTLNQLRMFLDRPAMHQPFKIEGNMTDFLTAITDVIRAFNTGILKTREGDEICRIKPRTMLSNPKWMEKLEIITYRFIDLRTRFEIAIRNDELVVQSNGFYYFKSKELPFEIDAMRDAIVLLFNELLKEAELPTLNGIQGHLQHPRFWEFQ